MYFTYCGRNRINWGCKWCSNIVIPLICRKLFFFFFYFSKWGDTLKKKKKSPTISSPAAFTELSHSSLYQSLAGREELGIFSLSRHSFSWIKCSQQRHWLSTDWHSIRRGGSSIQIRGGKKDLNKLTALSSITAETCQFAVVPETRLSVLLRTY